MLGELKSSHRMILIAIILVLLVALLIFGFISMSNFKPNNNNKTKLKDNELIFKDYIYTLPEGWQKNKEFSDEALNIMLLGLDDHISYQLGAIIDVQKIADIGYTGDDIFQDITFFENSLKNSKNFSEVGEGYISQYGDTSMIIIPCVYANSSKLLMLYVPAYEGYFYYVKYYYNETVNGVDEQRYNYDYLFYIVDFLNSRRKK